MEKNQLKIKKAEERKLVYGILAENGYTVRTVQVKKPNCRQKAMVVEYWKEEDNE